MRRFLVISSGIIWTVLPGCVADGSSANRVVGDFRLIAYPHADVQYLFLRTDHSFTLWALDRSRNGLDQSAPPRLLVLSGAWRSSHGEVVFGGFSGSRPSGFTPECALVGPDGIDGLHPIDGAGYIPPFKFVRAPLPGDLTTRLQRTEAGSRIGSEFRPWPRQPLSLSLSPLELLCHFV